MAVLNHPCHNLSESISVKGVPGAKQLRPEYSIKLSLGQTVATLQRIIPKTHCKLGFVIECQFIRMGGIAGCRYNNLSDDNVGIIKTLLISVICVSVISPWMRPSAVKILTEHYFMRYWWWLVKPGLENCLEHNRWEVIIHKWWQICTHTHTHTHHTHICAIVPVEYLYKGHGI